MLLLEKRRQVERISAVLHTEHAKEEAVANQDDTRHDQDESRLLVGVSNAGSLDGQADDSESKDAVCRTISYSNIT